MVDQPDAPSGALAGRTTIQSGFAAAVHGKSSLASWFISAAAAAARDAYSAASESKTIDRASANNLAGRGEIQITATAVVMAATALDACCNHYIDALLGSPLRFSKGEIAAFEKLLAEKIPTYEKLKCILSILNFPDIGQSPYQDVKYLLRLRNCTVHCRVANSEVELPRGHRNLAKHLEKQGVERRPAGTVIYMPLSYLQWRCARWAVDTILRVSADFSQKSKQSDCMLESGFDLSLSPIDQ